MVNQIRGIRYHNKITFGKITFKKREILLEKIEQIGINSRDHHSTKLIIRIVLSLRMNSK